MQPTSDQSIKTRGWGWTLLAIVLITVGALLAPVAVVSAWAHNQLTDTSYFVDTFAPLADDPAVQDFVAAETVAAIESKLQIDQLADDLFSGINDLDIGPRAKEALNLLQAPAVAGVKSLIEDTVTEFVRSDAFSAIWRQALTVTHTQLVNTATGQDDAVITVGDNQEVSLQLGPIIQAVKENLVANGFALAERIPAVSRNIVLAQFSSVGTYATLYNLVVVVGIWLPWITLLLLAAGVFVARRRAIALVWASGALLVSMVLVSAGINMGQNFFVLEVSAAIPRDAAVTLYAGLLVFVRTMIVVVGVLAATVLIVTALAGPWPWATKLRGFAESGFAAIRRRFEQHGITTGSAGQWLHQWQLALRIAVAVACSAVILFVRPLSPAIIVWTAVIGVVLVALLSLASRPPAEDVAQSPST